MKRIILLTILVTLLFPALSQAAPPKFVDTAAYQNLVNYVNELNSKKTTAATPEEKTAFTTNLNNKALAAKQRSTQLFEARKKYQLQLNANALKRVTLKLTRKYNRNVNLVKNNLRIDVEQQEFRQRDAIRNSTRKINRKINLSRFRLRELRQKYYDSTSGAAKTRLQKQINAELVRLDVLKGSISKSTNKIESRYAKIFNKLKAEAKQDINKLTRKLNRNKRSQKASFNRKYNRAKRTFISRKDQEHAIVNNLKERGLEYINLMPPLL
jgi:hypothetical protein